MVREIPLIARTCVYWLAVALSSDVRDEGNTGNEVGLRLAEGELGSATAGVFSREWGVRSCLEGDSGIEAVPVVSNTRKLLDEYTRTSQDLLGKGWAVSSATESE